MKILGVDPALTNTGLALFNHIDENNTSIIDLCLIRTSSSKDKNIRKNVDDFNRASFLYSSIQPWVEKADVVCLELPQIAGANVQARSMWSSGIVLGLMSTLKKPVVLLTPIEVKSITGNKKASKDEMISWATSIYPNAPWLKVKRHGQLVLTDNNEHLADAVAAGHAGFKKALDLFTAT